jgi:hypothetical protein
MIRFATRNCVAIVCLDVDLPFLLFLGELIFFGKEVFLLILVHNHNMS